MVIGAAVLVQMRILGVQSISNAKQTVITALIGLGLSLIGTCFIALARGAKGLDFSLCGEITRIGVELQAEHAKNAMPDIRGELFDFERQTYGLGHDYGVWSSHARVRFTVAVCNHRDVLTNIDRLEIDGTGTKTPCSVTILTFGGVGDSFDELPSVPPDVELPRGIQKHLVGTALVQMNVDVSTGPTKLDVTRLKPILMDGFGNRHQLSVRAGEVVEFVGRPDAVGGETTA